MKDRQGLAQRIITPEEPSIVVPTLDLSRRGFLGFASAAAIAGLSSPAYAGLVRNSTQALLECSKLVNFEIEKVSEFFFDQKTGEKIRFIYGKKGEFRGDYRVLPKGFIPFEHYHKVQSEVFDMRAGSNFILRIDGKKHVAKKGMTVTVPAGADHIGHNAGTEEAQFVVDFLPKLDADLLFERYWKICNDGHVDAHGRPNLGRLLEETCDLKSATYNSHIPEPLQVAAREAAAALKKAGKKIEHCVSENG